MSMSTHSSPRRGAPAERQTAANPSLLGSIFLAPQSSLYASIDEPEAEHQLPFYHHHGRHPSQSQSQSQAQQAADPFLLQPSDLDRSNTSLPPARTPGSGGARSLLAHMQPNRPFTGLQNVFEQDEDDQDQDLERGRSKETIFRQEPHSAQVTPSASPSRSHSRSPPPDLTHHPAPASPQAHRANPNSHVPPSAAADESRSLSSPSSSTAGFHMEGLHVGHHSRDSALVSLVKGIFGLLAWPFRIIAGQRSSSVLDRRQRALWTWVNVDDLDAFLSDVYSYYAGKGIYCIALANLLNLVTIGFVIAFSTFLMRCIDYSSLRSKNRLQDVMVKQCVSGHPLTLVLVVVASIVYAFQVYKFSRMLDRLYQMHDFFEQLLEIPESDIQTIPWDNIVNQLSNLRAEHPSAPSLLQRQPEDGPVNPLKLDAHDVANRVMREENYMVALFHRDILDLSIPWPSALVNTFPALKNVGKGDLTKVLEWNLRKGLIQYLFGPNAKVRKAFLDATNRDVLVEGLQRRLVLLGWLNALFAPFIVIYVLIYSFFRYFEEYHKNPSNIGSRKFTNMARWRFREYNELPHVFDNRLRHAHPLAEVYLDQFPKAKTAMVARFVAFVSGAFAGVLVLFSLIDPDAFLHFEITQDRSVFFYIGLFGGILAVARGMVPEEHRIVDPERLMSEISAHTHYLPDRWHHNLHSYQVHAEFASLFQVKATTFFIELLSVVTTPFVLWYSLPACAPNIIDFFREFTIHVNGLGYVCSFGVFDFKRAGKTSSKPAAAAESKMDRSMLSFAQWHPAWVPREQSTSLYLSQIQQQPRNPSRPTRFAGAGMASTALINEERQAENWASQPEAGSSSQGGNITPRQVGSPSDRGTESSAGLLEEDGLGESYEDGHVLKQRKGSIEDAHEQGKGPHSLVNMLLNDPPNARGW